MVLLVSEVIIVDIVGYFLVRFCAFVLFGGILVRYIE